MTKDLLKRLLEETEKTLNILNQLHPNADTPTPLNKQLLEILILRVRDADSSKKKALQAPPPRT
jgi:hypothetical protein